MVTYTFFMHCEQLVACEQKRRQSIDKIMAQIWKRIFLEKTNFGKSISKKTVLKKRKIQFERQTLCKHNKCSQLDAKQQI